MYRTIRMICPRAELGWLDAMYAELPAIDDAGTRASWLAGAAGLLATIVQLRAATVVSPLLWIAIVASFAGVVMFAIGSQSDVESAGMDDDVFFRFAWVAAALLVGFSAFAIIKIFVMPDNLRRHRH
jgi:hypothetical protein